MNNPANSHRFARKMSFRSFFAKDNGRLLRRTFLIAFLLLSLGLLTSGAIEIHLRYKESALGIRVLQQEMAEGAAFKIQQYIESITQQLEMVSQTPEVGTEGITDSYQFLLNKLLRVSPAVTSVTVLDATGHEKLKVSRVEVVPRGDAEDHSTNQAIVQGRTGVPFFGQVYFVRQSEPYMRIAVPIERFAGEVIGVLIAEVNLKYIWDVILRIRMGETGYAYVVSPEGDLVAHSDISLVLQKQNLKHLKQVQTALAGVQSQSTKQNLQNEDVYATHASIPDLGWVVIVERLTDEAYAPLYTSLLRLVLLLLVGLGMAGGASWLIVRRVMHPIEALREGAERLGAGELDYRTNVQTGDELEMFADTFNRMAVQLQTSYTTLEERVAERTRELARSVEKLENLSEHKSQFLAHMSHELRTPLNAIVGYTELVLDNAFGEIPSEARENLERVQLNSNHLLKLINSVLDFSRIESGRFDLRLSEYSLHDLIETAVIALEHMAAAKELTLSVTMPSELPVGWGDERWLAQVWFNLVGNAIAYTELGDEIRIEARLLQEGMFKVEVTDTGPGIAREDQGRIFEAFEQAHTSSTRVRKGTGLGLPMCQRIIEMHGGSIGVSSTLGQGSTFWCTFPVRIPD